MRKMILFSLLMATFLNVPFIQNVTADNLPLKLPAALKQLEKESGGTLDVTWSMITTTPSKLTGSLSLPSKHSPQWISFKFLNKWKILYGLQNPNRDMKAVEVEHRQDRIIVHLQHLLFQTPVWEDWLVIEMNYDGVITRVEGTIHPRLEKQLFNRPMHPAISKKQAIERAKAWGHGELANAPEVMSYYLASRSGTPLIYVVKLQYRMPERVTTTMIHSLTGRIIEQNNH